MTRYQHESIRIVVAIILLYIAAVNAAVIVGYYLTAKGMKQYPMMTITKPSQKDYVVFDGNVQSTGNIHFSCQNPCEIEIDSVYKGTHIKMTGGMKP